MMGMQKKLGPDLFRARPRDDVATAAAAEQRRARPLTSRLALLVLLSLSSPVPAAALNDRGARLANAIYRCGSAYSQISCPNARVLDLDDGRSEADRAAGRDIAGRERALAAEMKLDRERSDAAGRTVVRHSRKTLPPAHTQDDTARLGPVPPRSSNSSRRNARREASGEDFVAFVPRPPKETAAKKMP